MPSFLLRLLLLYLLIRLVYPAEIKSAPTTSELDAPFHPLHLNGLFIFADLWRLSLVGAAPTDEVSLLLLHRRAKRPPPPSSGGGESLLIPAPGQEMITMTRDQFQYHLELHYHWRTIFQQCLQRKKIEVCILLNVLIPFLPSFFP